MIRFVVSRSLRNWGVAIAALLAGALLSPRTSDAGCGDYVWIQGRPVRMAHSTQQLPTTGTGSSNNAAGAGSTGRPCQGPGCSDDSFPPQVPAPVIVVSIDRWAMTAIDPLPILVSCAKTLADRFDVVVDGFRLSILRPPR